MKISNRIPASDSLIESSRLCQQYLDSEEYASSEFFGDKEAIERGKAHIQHVLTENAIKCGYATICSCLNCTDPVPKSTYVLEYCECCGQEIE